MRPAVHANCLIIGTKGILIRGASGGGKSTLADFLIEEARKKGHLALHVSDDRVFLNNNDDRLIASAPSAIKGKIEVRAFGICEVETADEAKVDLCIDLLPAGDLERLPERAISAQTLSGVQVPTLQCPVNDPTASIRMIRWALRSLFPSCVAYI